MSRIWILPLALLLGGCPGGERGTEGVPEAVREQLRAGVNISHWFDHRDDPGHDPMRHEPSADELTRLRTAGLRHVRLTVNPAPLLENAVSQTLRHGAVQEVRSAIRTIQKAGLMTVLVIQPREGSKARLSERPELREGFARFWSGLAGALADIPPEALVFELLNEPETEEPGPSRAMYVAVVDAVREVAPRHTLVVSGHRWSSVEDLEALRPLDDDNIVYGFHFYDPHNFTHQGAGWGWPMWRKLAGLPYPSSPEAVQRALEILPEEARPHARQYGQERWNRQRLAAKLNRAQAWAARHGVPVWCSEFGVYRYNVHERFRQAWLRDVRELLVARGIGWTVWNFSGHFGLLGGRQGNRRLDAGDWYALGLDPSPFLNDSPPP